MPETIETQTHSPSANSPVQDDEQTERALGFVRKLLEKMDNPTKLLYMPESDDIITIKGKHVYHVNMIIKYGMFGHEDVFRRFRIIVSRSGIKKILEITPTSGNL